MNIRLITLFTALFVVVQQGRPQIDSLYDVFPLAVGNQWTYRYLWSNGNVDYVDSDSGTATFTVVNSVQTVDSIMWGLSEGTDLVHKHCSNYPPYDCTRSEHNLDTFLLELFERRTGWHQLFFAGGNGVMPFNRTENDTNRLIYRYRNNPYWSYTCPPQPGPPSECSIQFHEGQGELGYSGRFGYYYNYSSWNHSLLSAVISSIRTTGVSQPEQFVLDQNYPNPFNPNTRIEFKVPRSGFVSLKVYDVLGREVVTLVNEELKPGSYERTFDGSGLANGVYFYRLRAGEFVDTKKLVLLR